MAPQVTPDPVFQREGADVHIEQTLRLAQAVLGGSITIPTLDGEAELAVRRLRASLW